MPDDKPSFWTPRTVAAVIGVVLLVVALAYLVSLPQNQFQPADLLQPKYAADADLGYWMVYEYDPEVDVYHLLVVMQHPNGTFEWLDGDGIWLPRRAVEGTFTVIGSFDRRKAHHVADNHLHITRLTADLMQPWHIYHPHASRR